MLTKYRRKSILNHKLYCSIFKADFFQLILDQICRMFSAVVSSATTVIQIQDYTTINELVLETDFAEQYFLRKTKESIRNIMMNMDAWSAQKKKSRIKNKKKAKEDDKNSSFKKR